MEFGGRIVVIGLGYVGLPLAVALARHFAVIGFDIDEGRVAELRAGADRTNEVAADALKASSAKLTAEASDCAGADVYIVTVPTPVDQANRPDLTAVMAATRAVAKLIDPTKRPTIVYESTVYPGVTEEMCGPEIERVGGLKRGRDFRLGYSPERINPGDREHTVDRITKVIAGEDGEVVEQLAAIYGAVTSGGVFRAASILTTSATWRSRLGTTHRSSWRAGRPMTEWAAGSPTRCTAAGRRPGARWCSASHSRRMCRILETAAPSTS